MEKPTENLEDSFTGSIITEGALLCLRLLKAISDADNMFYIAIVKVEYSITMKDL